MRGRAPALGNFCGITGALGCSCIGSPPSESSRQGFYGSGELRSGLLAEMIAFRFRWLLLPASYLSQEGEISPQLGARVLAARGSGEEQGPPARGGGSPDLGKAALPPPPGKVSGLLTAPPNPRFAVFCLFYAPQRVATLLLWQKPSWELPACSVRLSGGRFCILCFAPSGSRCPPQGQAGLTALELPAPCLEEGALRLALKFCTLTWVFNIQTIREI